MNRGKGAMSRFDEAQTSFEVTEVPRYGKIDEIAFGIAVTGEVETRKRLTASRNLPREIKRFLTATIRVQSVNEEPQPRALGRRRDEVQSEPRVTRSARLDPLWRAFAHIAVKCSVRVLPHAMRHTSMGARQQLEKELAQVGDMRPGSLVERFRKCGTASCHCGQARDSDRFANEYACNARYIQSPLRAPGLRLVGGTRVGARGFENSLVTFEVRASERGPDEREVIHVRSHTDRQGLAVLAVELLELVDVPMPRPMT